jgi:hypothetical protein
MSKVAWLATADARGHLMRAQLLAKALRSAGLQVEVLTTSHEGRRFLAGFGVDAGLLSCHYAVQFDACQNMLREATDANVAHYVFRPSRMLRDMLRLRALLRDNDLVINDSFHPALLVMGCLPVWRRKVVHVYGDSLRHALEGNFERRLPAWLARLFGAIVAWQIDASRARLAHDFSYDDVARRVGASIHLPTPVAIVDAARARSHDDGRRRAAVYLNPHFRQVRLAGALERGLARAGLTADCVGEGYAGRPGWRARDTDWVERAAASDVIVSAPGMAALSVALVYDRPIVLVLTDQPEQRLNAVRAVELGLRHRVVEWRDDEPSFAQAIQAACDALCPSPAHAHVRAHAAARGGERASTRLQAWVSTIVALAA